MGASVSEITSLLGSLERRPRETGPVRVLDIGAQNLVASNKEEIASFVSHFGDHGEAGNLDVYTTAMAAGALRYPWGSINGSWLGDLLARIGMNYVAFDIFPGPWTTIFDLNTQILHMEHREAFDLVLNCGTTEHVFNQYNAFRTIHDACRVGGMMYHALPMIGFLNDGYFAYTPAFFQDLAMANGYEVVDMRFRGPGPIKPILQTLDELGFSISDTVSNASDWKGAAVADALAAVTLRRTEGGPFHLPLLTRATVGSVAGSIRQAYGIPSPVENQTSGAEAVLQRTDPAIAAQVRAVVARFRETNSGEFPVAALVERTSLARTLGDRPQAGDLLIRLHDAERTLGESWPLFRLSQHADAQQSGEAGIQAGARDRAGGRHEFQHAMSVFRQRLENRQIEQYPLILELTALNYATMELYPDDWQLTKCLALCAEKLVASLRIGSQRQ